MASNVTETPVTRHQLCKPSVRAPTHNIASSTGHYYHCSVCYLSQPAKKTYTGAGQELHVTARRIDAIGTLKAKTKQKLAAQEADNLQCRSIEIVSNSAYESPSPYF